MYLERKFSSLVDCPLLQKPVAVINSYLTTILMEAYVKKLVRRMVSHAGQAGARGVYEK